MDNVFRSLDLIHTDFDSRRRLPFNHQKVPALGRCKPSNRSLWAVNPSQRHSVPDLRAPNSIVRPHPLSSFRSFAGPRLEERKGCPCKDLSLGANPSHTRSAPHWGMTPGWSPDATYAEIRREESRRLVWHSVGIVGIDAVARIHMKVPQLDLQMSDPRNVSLHDSSFIFLTTGNTSMTYSILGSSCTSDDLISTEHSHPKSQS